MNLLEELRSLDPRDPGRWPLRSAPAPSVVAFLVATVGAHLFLRVERATSRAAAVARPKSSRCARVSRRSMPRPSTSSVYKQQLKDIERSFGALLRQLPGKTEVPSLLVDISQTGLAAGLQEKLFQPAAGGEEGLLRRAAHQDPAHRQLPPVRRVRERHRGTAAHRHAATTSSIKSDSKDAYDQLSLELTAKTYRYLDEDEIAAGEADKNKNAASAPSARRRALEHMNGRCSTTYA